MIIEPAEVLQVEELKPFGKDRLGTA